MLNELLNYAQFIVSFMNVVVRRLVLYFRTDVRICDMFHLLALVASKDLWNQNK
jgi:hypothetical protein